VLPINFLNCRSWNLGERMTYCHVSRAFCMHAARWHRVVAHVCFERETDSRIPNRQIVSHRCLHSISTSTITPNR
jgi:hypothetical protein